MAVEPTSNLHARRIREPRAGLAETEQLSLRHSLEVGLGVPSTEGNRLTLLRNGDRIFPAMLAAIDAAEHSVEFLTFVYWRGEIADRFADALVRAVGRGVRARVVLDAIGARPMQRRLLRHMERGGVEIRWFRPLSWFRLWRWDKRTHRKILVCDSTVGFTGGVGIAEQWMGDARDPSEWRETHVRVEGPAVAGLRAAFTDNWNEAGPWEYSPAVQWPRPRPDGVPVQVIRGSSTIAWTEIAELFRVLVASARQRIVVTTPYFLPDAPLLGQLTGARERGVDLDFLIAGKYCDLHWSQWAAGPAIERLLESGATVRLYQKTMVHAKTIVVDGFACCVGSPNLNYRSASKDEECCIVAFSEQTAAELERDFRDDCRYADSLDLSQWKRRSVWVRLRERLAGVFREEL